MKSRNQPTTLKDIKRIASSNVTQNDTYLPFVEQLNRFINGDMPSGDVLIVSKDMKTLGLSRIAENNFPLIVKQSVINKAINEHVIIVDTLNDLPQAIKNNVLILESITQRNAYLVFLDKRDIFEREIFIALHLNKELNGVTINKIASIYGKNNLSYLLENSMRLNKRIIKNNKTNEWLSRTGVSFPERGTTR